MSTTFNLELKKQPTSQGRFQVYIRITKDRKLKRIKTSISLSKLSDWNPNTRNGNYIRVSEPHSKKWNDVLKKELDEVRASFLEDTSSSLNKIVDSIKNKNKEKSFLEYSRGIIQQKFAQGASNAKHYKSFLNKLESFLSSRKQNELFFSDITTSFLSKFESFLHTQNNERVSDRLLNQNYIKALMVKFRAIINRAINIDGLMKVEDNPFRNYKLTEVKTMKEKLEGFEIEAIEALDLPTGSVLWNTRNCFLFSFYCAGIRVADTLQLRWENISASGRIHYQMGKTHKVKEMNLVIQAQDILKQYWKEDCKPTDYIFPFLKNDSMWAKYVTQEQKDTMPIDLKRAMQRQISSNTALLNKYLKIIAEKAKISKNLTFHISRHSFTYQAMKKGTQPMILKEALGHSSLSITERYMGEFNTQEVDKALQNVFSKPSSKEMADELLESLKRLDKKTLKSILSNLQNKKA